MRGKSEETSINESSSNSDHQTVPSNSNEEVRRVDSTDVNQQQEQVLRGKASEEPPPPSYYTISRPPPSPKPPPQVENVNQNPSINNQRSQGTPLPDNQINKRYSTRVVCPNCGATVQTRVETSSTIITVLLAVLLFFFCFLLALIPFCMSACKKTIHYCPNCNAVLREISEFH